MRLILKDLRNLILQDDEKQTNLAGYKWLKVQYCAICRTDAKMWDQGHRDLVLPRVLGHEMVVADSLGGKYIVWPGDCCGTCRYCKSNRENLCDEMKITGFHHDGGFSDYVHVKEESLIPLPISIPLQIGTFAEPVGCVFHALNKVNLNRDERIIIYGGGTLGIITALIAKEMMVSPIVIEKNEEKIDKITPFLEFIGVPCVKNIDESEFDVVINACPDPIAFELGIDKLAKGGRFSFFSGLNKNQLIGSDRINLTHYKENVLYGSYGLTRKNMYQAIHYLNKFSILFEYLIEEIITPEKVQKALEDVLRGISYKYILDFTGQ
ncbi:MAG: alcohol dehydrogenase catalytic domain-containing protein [Spirochaetota bacterium]|nr:alcohol dehydrogenase catalytic domain-containing protein [Spirochaetota bacterium]